MPELAPRVPKALAAHVRTAVEAAQRAGDLPTFEVPEMSISRPKNPEHGDYASNAALQLQNPADMKGKSRQIAEIIVEHLPDIDFVSEVDLAGPGFINFRLKTAWLQTQVDAILAAGDAYPHMVDFDGKRVQIECVSANPTGPITVGRIRGGILGDTLGRAMERMGYEVSREYYFNNAGRQMMLLGESVRARYRELLGLQTADDFPPDGYQGNYIVDLAQGMREAHGDDLADAGWTVFKDYAEEQVSAAQRESLKKIGIVFDNYFNEADLYLDKSESGWPSVWDTLAKLDAKGLTYKALLPEKDEDIEEAPDAEEREAAETGEATWLRTRQIVPGKKKDVAVVRSNGEPTYRLPDIAYHVTKMERGFDVAVNVLGTDHIEEAKDVRGALAALGYDSERLQHIIHQFVTIVEQGEEKKQSTRKGQFVALDDLIGQIGEKLIDGPTPKDIMAADAVRYFVLSYSPNSTMRFDIDLAVKQSNENPVYYIQNAHVRCASIAREAEARGIEADGNVSMLTEAAELDLIRK
ncbi:MAG: arginine--tRNA ligase, partial [Chloroflexi bacterium]|nr:arginine--tRNA ligase [Chloroflexota bacterium]